MSKKEYDGLNEAQRRLRDGFLDITRKLGLEVKTIEVDMTGGGRPYCDWNNREKGQAERALKVINEGCYFGWEIVGKKLPAMHPYHSLNDNGKRHAATSLYLERIEEAHKMSAKSKLRFVKGEGIAERDDIDWDREPVFYPI